MALPWLKLYRLMGKNTRSVLGMVCLIAWLVPIESWAQGSLFNDLKAMATQVVRDKIKVVPAAIPNTLPSQQPAQAPITTSANARSSTADRIDYDKISDFSGQINPTVFKNETAEMRQSATGNVLILHPFQGAPAILEKTVFVNSANTSLEFSVRGHPLGDFLARVVAVSRTGKQDVLYEKTIVGNRGWYVESIDLSRYRGQSVTLRFEAHATGWHFEYVGLDYFFVRGDGSRAAYNSNGISSSGDVAPEIIKQSERCSLPRTFADTKMNFPVCVNTPTEPLVRKNGCYQGSDQYNAKARQFALLALKSADSCVTYPYRGDLYDVFGNAVHAGIDLRENNVPVYAISSGTVDEAIFDTKSSPDVTKQRSTLIIQSADKRQKTLYLHMSEILPQKGEYVNRGDKVGIAGGIGAMSPHLHVEVWTADSPNYQKDRAITGNSSCGGRCKDSDIAILTADPFIVLNTNLDSGVISTNSGLSGNEVAKALGPTREQDRAAAIAEMVKQGAIRSQLTADELAVILKGTTGGNRSYAIAQLGSLIKSRLTAPEAATVLGTVNELREQDRAAAIQSIAKANAYAKLAGDAALILEGTTGGNRSFAIAELANFFKKGLSASAVSEALGTVQQLREQDRAAAIRALVSASVPGLWGGEASEPLNGCTGGNRSYAIAQLAPRLRASLTGTEVASILGRPEELREQDRAAAIRSVVDARRLRLPFSGDELELVLTGTTGGNRSYAIGLLAQRR